MSAPMGQLMSSKTQARVIRNLETIDGKAELYRCLPPQRNIKKNGKKWKVDKKNGWRER